MIYLLIIIILLLVFIFYTQVVTLGKMIVMMEDLKKKLTIPFNDFGKN